MKGDYWESIHSLLDCFNEGILVIGPDDRIIINDSFKEMLNIRHGPAFEIMDAIDKCGLGEILDSNYNTEKEIIINDVKMKAEKHILKLSKLSLGVIIISNIIDDGENSNSKISGLKKSLDAMKDILDNAYQGIVLVDKDARIIKWNYEKLLGIKEEDVLGKPVEEVVENTRLHIVLKTGEKELCDVQRIQGHDMIASRTPIIKDGAIIGAVGTVLFKDVGEVKALAKRLEVLENTVDKYKNEINSMYYARYSFDNIITQNEKMLKLKDIAKKHANSNSTILIQGESGTGKEYFAHAIHNESSRKYGPFIRINCAAIPHELLESELFGHEGGAFTGARKEGRIGKFELANGGTILLDEICSMPYNMQAKLLRVLEERELERIGGNARIKIDVRVIACTNENLRNAIKEGRFRQDLYYRLNVLGIDIPPLRDRLDDIPVLSEYILNELVQKARLSYKVVSNRSMQLLQAHNWPGNVRELRNVLERAANVSSNNYINPEHLPDYINTRPHTENVDKTAATLKERMAEAEISAIIEALKLSNGNRTDAARYLGIHRTALYKKMDSYGIDIKNI